MLIVVTGGSGFIGSNLVPRLIEQGHQVRVLDNGVAGNPTPADAPEVELVDGDIRDSQAVAGALRGAEAVVHLAAAGNVAQSVADPFPNFDVNALGTLVVLQAAAAAGVRRFVFASTGGALIGEAAPPVDESSVPRPISPYGASKLCGEGYCHAFRGSYGLNTLALRFANVYGPRSAHKKGAVTAFIERALRGEPLVIYGDGAATRDFIHVEDLCAGILSGLQREEVGGVVHLASGRETTIAELAALVLEATGSSAPIEHHPARAGEVERNFASAALAAEILGFRPRFDLEDGMADTVAWFRARL